MAGWGVGIGSFATNFASGMHQGQALRLQKLQEQRAQQELQEGDLRLKSARRNDANAVREDQMNKQIVGLGQNAVGAYDQAVSQGQFPANHFSDFYIKNVAPKIEQVMIANGDHAKAKAFRDWYSDEDNKNRIEQTGTLINQLGQAKQTGDYSYAEKTFKQLYNNMPDEARSGGTFDSFKTAQDPKTGQFSITANFKDGKGKPFAKSWNDWGSFEQEMDNTLHPSNVFEAIHGQNQAQIARNKALGAEKDKADVDLYKQGEEVKRGLKDHVTPLQLRSEAAKVVDARHKDAADGDTLSPDKRDAEIEEEMRRSSASLQRFGAPGLGNTAPANVPAPQMIDTKTGQPVSGAPAPAGDAASPTSITAPRPGSSGAPAAAAADNSKSTGPAPAPIPMPVSQGTDLYGNGAVAPGLATGAIPTPVAATGAPQQADTTGQAVAPTPVNLPVQSAPQRAPGIGVDASANGPYLPSSGIGDAISRGADAVAQSGVAISDTDQQEAAGLAQGAGAAARYVGGAVAGTPEYKLAKQGAVAAAGGAKDALTMLGAKTLQQMNAARASKGLAPITADSLATPYSPAGF